MKKRIYNIIILSLSSLIFFSCEYEIDYNDDLPGDKLVLTSFAEADSTISFFVHKSGVVGSFYNQPYETPLNRYNPNLIRDCKIELFSNGELKETLTSLDNQTGKYTFTHKPKQDDKIDLKIIHSQYPEVEASADLAISLPEVDSLGFSIVRGEYEPWAQEAKLMIYIEIDATEQMEDCYYQLSADLRYYYSSYELGYFDTEKESHVGTFTSPNSSMAYRNNFGIFSNALFKGQKYTLVLSEDISINSNHTDEQVREKLSGSFTVSKIEGKAYKYLHTLNMALGNNMMNTEPVIIDDGLENGYGFFAGRRSRTFVVEDGQFGEKR